MVRKQTTKAPLTTAQQLGSIIKSARDIMRKDKGLNGDLDRLPMLTWIMFLKFLDDLEQLNERNAFYKSKKYRPTIDLPYRWRDWAANEKEPTGEQLMAFINNEEVTLADGKKRKGLFAYLRGLEGENGGDRRDVVATVFKGINNRMVSGYLLRDVVNKINRIHFNSTEEIHTLGHLYESMLKEMRDAAGDSGEFYTPRAVVRFMVEVTNPRLGEIVLDPACGTGGFLVEAFNHLKAQVKNLRDKDTLQKASIFGGEAKPLPYMLAQMNLLLHGMESPQISPDNSLKKALRDITDKDRVDVILTNPPFGGEEERGILPNFPDDRRTAETALLFLQLIMSKLKRTPTARAAIVVPNGLLFGDKIAAYIKEDLLTGYNLHTIVRLPNGVFSPYTNIPTNLLFFDRNGPTKEIWYYEQPMPEGRKNYSKTAPIQYEHFEACLAWWHNREENERAWKIDFKALYDEKKAEAKPHWEAADRADEAAKQHTRKAKELGEEIQGLDNLFTEQAPRAKERKNIRTMLDKLMTERAEALAIERQQRELAREERVKGDAIYWPIYNLDIKNPNKIDDAHRDLEELLAEYRQLMDEAAATRNSLKQELMNAIGGMGVNLQTFYENFELIVGAPNGVRKLRELILQLAVQGKLVSQNPNDEPASVLLERITVEEQLMEGSGRKKKARFPAVETNDEPFALQQSWLWVRMGQLTKLIEYGTSEKASLDNKGVPVLRMGNINNGKIHHTNLKYVPPTIKDLPHLYLKHNDLLFNRTNSIELVGKTGIFKGEDNSHTFASYLIRLRLLEESILPDFVCLAMNANYYRETQINPEVTQQCGQANFNGTKLANTLIPLPPLEEQRRIIAKVDQLTNLCDELKAKLTQAQATSESLTASMINHLFSTVQENASVALSA